MSVAAIRRPALCSAVLLFSGQSDDCNQNVIIQNLESTEGMGILCHDLRQHKYVIVIIVLLSNNPRDVVARDSVRVFGLNIFLSAIKSVCFSLMRFSHSEKKILSKKLSPLRQF